jgi:hypothetical protein
MSPEASKPVEIPKSPVPPSETVGQRPPPQPSVKLPPATVKEAPATALVASKADTRLMAFQYICDEIQRATTLPEALALKAYSERLELQSLIDQDKAAQRCYAKAQLSAMQKAGEIISDSQKQPSVRDRSGKFTAPVEQSDNRLATDDQSVEGQKSKAKVLQQHGMALRTAARYERLAGPPKPEVRQAVRKASEDYFAERLRIVGATRKR